jgi:hypothetical protein
VKGLPPPAQYTPWLRGTYDVAPSLKPLGTDFGNGEADWCWFQFDYRFDEFRDSKRKALEENYSKYVHRDRLDPEVEVVALQAISRELAREYPDRFEVRAGALHASLAESETLIGSLDELAPFIQEDVCVVRTEGENDWLAYLHICSPSHWRASEKIGKPFFDVHQVIPGFERVNRAAASLVEAMVHKGPWVRFVWGVESDPRANHHPDPPPGNDPFRWQGRDFTEGRFWVRSERQVIWGLPEVDSALFTIKVSHMPGEAILTNPEWRRQLILALESMSLASREYKGLANDWDGLMKILRP